MRMVKSFSPWFWATNQDRGALKLSTNTIAKYNVIVIKVVIRILYAIQFVQEMYRKMCRIA